MDGPDSRTDKHSITFRALLQPQFASERPLLSHMDIAGRQIWRTGIHPKPPFEARGKETAKRLSGSRRNCSNRNYACNFAVKLVISGRHAFAIRCLSKTARNSHEQPGSLLFSETHADRKPRESEADNRHLADILLQKTAKTARAG